MTYIETRTINSMAKARAESDPSLKEGMTILDNLGYRITECGMWKDNEGNWVDEHEVREAVREYRRNN